MRSWSIYAKNRRVNSDARRVAPLFELAFLQWGFMCFPETRCSTEDIILSGGHRFISSLESTAVSGVAILVHSKHTEYVIGKHLVFDRVMAIDVKSGRKRTRIVAIYVPHAGVRRNAWEEFEAYLNNISMLALEATRLRMNVIIGGDFNISLNVGRRGECMKDFCRELNLQIANGSGLSNNNTNWTFRNTLGTLCRIHYILYSPGLFCEGATAT